MNDWTRPTRKQTIWYCPSCEDEWTIEDLPPKICPECELLLVTRFGLPT